MAACFVGSLHLCGATPQHREAAFDWQAVALCPFADQRASSPEFYQMVVSAADGAQCAYRSEDVFEFIALSEQQLI